MKIVNVVNGMPTVTEFGEQYIQCCDCGLVHLMKITLQDDGEFRLTAYRDDYLTDRIRNPKKQKKLRDKKK